MGRVGIVQRVSFDRAAGYYDATRGLPAEARAAMTEVLAAELADRQPCLEIGVGTGRIALPLAERGIAMAGEDISEAMLRRLVGNAGGRRPFPLMLADATRLPLAGESFGAVLACHVLHLIGDWRAAVDDAMRVLRRGGVLLADFGAAPGGRSAERPGERPTDRSGESPGERPAGTTPWREAVRQTLERHGIFRNRHGATDAEQVAGHIGCQARSLPPVRVTSTRTLRRTIEDVERQIYSWTWPYPAGQIQAACEEIRAWAQREDIPLDTQASTERLITWQAFDRPA
jgi:ubiquinone/menaquinone biosynthesis C-methylase UbiE